MLWDAVIEFTARQHGLVTTAQVRSTGATHRWLEWAVDDRKLDVVRRGVFEVVGAPRSEFRDLMAAVLAAGDAVGAGGLAAGWVWGAGDVLPGVLELLAFNGRAVRLRGVLVRRIWQPPAGLLVVRNNIPVVSAPLAIAQISHRSVDLAIAVTQDLVKKGRTTFSEIQSCFEGPVGSRVGSRLRRYVERAAGVRGHNDSPAARQLGEALLASNVPPFVAQCHVDTGEGDFYLDFAWPHHKVGLEFMGWKDHGMTRYDWERDARRRSLLTAVGWRILDATSAASNADVIRWVERTLRLAAQ